MFHPVETKLSDRDTPARMRAKATFQQRHCEAIAQVLNDVAPLDKSKAETRFEYRERIIRSLCAMFAEDNVHFNEDRFRVACIPGNPTSNTRRQGPSMPYVQPRR